jgi:hypothetical protein
VLVEVVVAGWQGVLLKPVPVEVAPDPLEVDWVDADEDEEDVGAGKTP